MAESRPAAAVGAQQGRHEKSLGRLTGKFVSLLREAKDGVLDLKVAADCLAVRQKRRIYDITNVLEGVGLIEKKNKNIIQWRGNALSSHSQEIQEQVDVLKAQISELDSQERELDRQKAWLEQSIEHMRHDPVTSTYAFLKYEDVYNIFNGDNLLAIVSPIGTQLEVPMPETDQSSWRKYQLTLRSQSGPIQVVMITNSSDPSCPVVFALPPVDYISTLLTPPNTPAEPHKFPTPSSSASSSFSSHGASIISSSSSSSCGLADPLCPDHQVAAMDCDGTLTPTSTPLDLQMECPGQSAGVVVQQMMVGQQDFPSILDVGSLMMINGAGDNMKEEREGVAEFLEELMSSEGVDYNFNLEDDEGACDLFDVQVLNF